MTQMRIMEDVMGYAYFCVNDKCVSNSGGVVCPKELLLTLDEKNIIKEALKNTKIKWQEISK